tara:strand:- start:43 stop:204 length:162 start_codon:yes stop_codon:yes gene_type:complete
MKKFLLITFFIMTSCSKDYVKKDITFSKNMSFDEFKLKLEEYAEIDSYPNIDN